MLDRDTLYELRSLLALYPYYQNARLLLLQNLYLLHDPTFDEELRRAAIYITDRKVIFQKIEAGHYKITTRRKQQKTAEQQDSRTLSLIDDFLDSLPKENEPQGKKTKRKPTPADAAVDYVAYLMECEADDDSSTQEETPQMKGQQLIDNFLQDEKGKIVLSDNPTLKPETEANAEEKKGDSDVFTETLARIYVKQGNYSRALQIIKKLSLDDSKKNAYFADQIRFLEKLIINNNKNKK